MRCSVCGKEFQPVERRYTSSAPELPVVEIICWGCKVWSETGYVMPARRN